jgi:hypothetical protein
LDCLVLTRTLPFPPDSPDELPGGIEHPQLDGPPDPCPRARRDDDSPTRRQLGVDDAEQLVALIVVETPDAKDGLRDDPECRCRGIRGRILYGRNALGAEKRTDAHDEAESEEAASEAGGHVDAPAGR